MYPYSREVLETLVSLGTEENSTFYWYDDFLFPEEEQGVYLMLNVWDPESETIDNGEDRGKAGEIRV